MPTDDQQVLVVGTASAPAHFTVPGNGQIQPKAVRAVYDGSSATSSFIPVLQIVSDAGIKVVECVGSQIAAGGSAAVSWFPWLGTNQTTVIGPGAGCVYFVGPPSGNAALDTGAIQAALDSLPATGGIVQLCRGTYQLASSGITIAGRCQLAGHGRFNTTLEYAFSTGTAITVTTTNTAWMLRDFSLSNTSGITPTAGSGVTVSGNSSYWQIIGMSVIGFWNCVVVTTSNSWTMNTTLLQDFVNHGIEISNSVNGDQGDFTFQDCHFFTGPTNTGATNAIHWTSAGGFKMNACKFNGNNPANTNSVGILFAVDDGVTTGSVSLVNNSIENYGYGIVFQAGGSTHTGFLDRITITGNEFECRNNQCVANPSVGGQYARIAIAANTFNDGVNGIVLGNVDNIVNGGNVFGGLSGSSVVVNAGVTNHTQYGVG